MCLCTPLFTCFTHRRMQEETERRLYRKKVKKSSKVPTFKRPVIGISQEVWEGRRQELYGSKSK